MDEPTVRVRSRPCPEAAPSQPAARFRTAEKLVLVAAVVIAAFAVLVGALIYLKPPPVRFVYGESASTRTGERVFRREGCLSCHELFGNGTGFGPALDGVGSRRDVTWLKQYLRSPRAGVGDRTWRLRMPAYDHLEEGELEALAIYLGALRELRELDEDGRIVEPPLSFPAESQESGTGPFDATDWGRTSMIRLSGESD